MSDSARITQAVPPRVVVGSEGPLVLVQAFDQTGRSVAVWVRPERALRLLEDLSRAVREAAEVERGEGL